MLRVAAAVLFCSVTLSWAWEEDGDVRVLSSNEQGCVIVFSPAQFRLDTLILNGKHYQNVDFRMASPTGAPGDPMLPCRVVVVGVPPKGNVRVSVEASDFVERAGIRLPPVPLLNKEDGLPVEVYEEGPAYKGEGFLPDKFFEAEAPAYFGNVRVVRILLFPIQFDPAGNRTREYRRIVLRVDFEERGVGGGGVEEMRMESVYRKAVINYSEARKWTVRPERDLMKDRRSLQAGIRYKIPVSQEGVFRVTGNFLQGQGVDIGAIDPTTLKIYNNGGRELPRDVGTLRPDSLMESPILVSGADDGRFDGSDYLLFYGKGVKDWAYDAGEQRYKHYIHLYTEQNVYWLVFNDGVAGRRIPSASPLSEEGAQKTVTYRDRIFFEKDISNPLMGGIHWFGDAFENGDTKSYDVTLSGPVSGEPIAVRFRLKGANVGAHLFIVRFNDVLIKTVQLFGTSFAVEDADFTGGERQGLNTLSFDYSGSGLGQMAYLDWFEVEYSRTLMGSNGRLRFFSPDETGLYDYHLSGFVGEPVVLDVTDVSTIRRMVLRSVSDGWAFVDSAAAGSPKRYAVVQGSGQVSPANASRDEVSSLRNSAQGADLLIVTHKDFYDQALRLKDLRENEDSLSVFIADIQDVYDEFSWGLSDPTAVRDFVKYAYERWTTRPSYLLLFGDGDYDYRDILPYPSENRVPVFEYDGLTESGSRASDDWFTTVAGNDSEMDLAVGRLPVQTVSEARRVVDKIIAYETKPILGDWRSLVTMVGDDEKSRYGDENEITHTRASEHIAENVIPPLFNFNKIYLTEYPEEITLEGRRKPKARDDLLEQINRGTLLVNYIGHGNEYLWAHEHIFELSRDLPTLRNEGRLPLIYAATCAFAKYDDPAEQSFAEALLNAEDAGAIAVIAACRFCSAPPNEALNEAFMETLFSESGPTERLGDALRAAKLVVTNRVNNEMYHILGDPTMRLGTPMYRAAFTSMQPDTFKALSVVQVEGRVEKDGELWADFNGRIVLKAFDSKKEKTYTTQYGTGLSYRLPGNALFRGEATAENGLFRISFIVPKDISYGGYAGRLHSYFTDGQNDGGGYRDGIKVGGSADLVDTEGPEITLFFTGQENFVSGDMVSEKPELTAVIRDDKSGVNITGELGHKIMLTVNGREKEDVTEYFQYDAGNYLEGRLLYTLSDVGEGEHDLIMKAWDNANNSSAQSLVFSVVHRGELRLEDVLNYPNPVRSSTHFTFKLSQDAEVEIKMFTVSGRLIRRMDGVLCEPGFNMIYWDGRDEMGDELANGVYLYKVIARSRVDGMDLKKEVIERLMVMR